VIFELEGWVHMGGILISLGVVERVTRRNGVLWTSRQDGNWDGEELYDV